MVRALAVAWTFSGCRSNEIERLEVGCTYLEHVPEQTDSANGSSTPAFDQPILRVPVNKTRGEFVKPIEAPLLEAIAVWERIRPVQPPTRDKTTGRLVHHLFSSRGRQVGTVLSTVPPFPRYCERRACRTTTLVDQSRATARGRPWQASFIIAHPLWDLWKS
jgi:hypothetical protein